MIPESRTAGYAKHFLLSRLKYWKRLQIKQQSFHTG